ncbi:MAG: hypothetical protein U0174_22710 [Polyangiaceae bacterium]
MSAANGMPLGSGIDGIEFRSDAIADKLAPLGTLCRTASDRDACLRKVMQTTPSKGAGWSTSFSDATGPGPTHYGVATRGDSVFLITTPAELAEAVGTIHSSREALAFIKLAYDADVVCNANNVGRAGPNFVVKSIQHGCDSITEILYSVTPNGTVTTKYNVLKKGDPDIDC